MTTQATRPSVHDYCKLHFVFFVFCLLSLVGFDTLAQDTLGQPVPQHTTYKKFLFFKWKKKQTDTIANPALKKLQREYDSLTALKQKLQIRKQQRALQDSLKATVLADTVPSPFYQPESIRFGTDLSHWVKGIASKKPTTFYNQNFQAEVNTELSFRGNKWFLVGEIGYASASPFLPLLSKTTQAKQLLPSNAFQYDIAGTYFRVGVEYNFMRKYFNDEALVVGVRYGRSFFNHSLTYSLLEDSLWNIRTPDDQIVTGEFKSNGLSADWFELVSGLKINVWKNFMIGSLVRLRFLNGVYGEEKTLTTSFSRVIFDPAQQEPLKEPITTYKQAGIKLIANEIPGFGNTESPVKLTFSLYVSYYLPLKKRPSVVIEQY